MEVQDAYKEKLEAQLKVWGAQIDVLEAKVEQMGSDLKVKRTEEICALRAKQCAASEKLKELNKSTGEAWTQVKNTADKVWEDLKAGLAAAHSKFK